MKSHAPYIINYSTPHDVTSIFHDYTGWNAIVTACDCRVYYTIHLLF